MARLVLGAPGGPTFQIRPNELRTIDLVTTPVMDASGLEVLYHRIALSVHALINPLMLATNQPAAATPGGWNAATGPGDRAGLTARAITQMMANPRPTVQYWIGPDLVLEAPNRLDAAGTRFLPCDPMGGPFVRRCRCFEVSGDKTISLDFTVELATTAYTKILLSNRWRMTSEVDSKGFTTRRIDGAARFRMDALADLGSYPDDFRNLLLVPADAGLKRMSASFTAMDVNDAYEYHVVDRETTYGTGAESGVEKVECTISVSNGRPFPTQKRLIEAGAGAVLLAASLPFLGPAALPVGLLGGAAAARGIWNAVTFETRLSCAVRVHGMNGTDPSLLYNCCMQVIENKVLSNINKSSTSGYAWVSLTVTLWAGSEDQPIVEARANINPLGNLAIGALWFASQAVKILDLNTGMPALGCDVDTPRTQLPNSSNTRGYYVGNVFAQALTGVPSDLPPAPFAPPVAVDMTTEV